jgi:hypothetical protein
MERYYRAAEAWSNRNGEFVVVGLPVFWLEISEVQPDCILDVAQRLIVGVSLAVTALERRAGDRPEDISKALSLKPEFSHAIGEKFLKTPAKWTFFYAVCKMATMPSSISARWQKLFCFSRRTRPSGLSSWQAKERWS